MSGRRGQDHWGSEIQPWPDVFATPEGFRLLMLRVAEGDGEIGKNPLEKFTVSSQCAVNCITVLMRRMCGY
jgi:hypothetical protein